MSGLRSLGSAFPPAEDGRNNPPVYGQALRRQDGENRAMSLRSIR